MKDINEKSIILSGIVGSKAYSLDTEESDTDRLGIFAVKTDQLFRLNSPQETISTTNPDITLHEAAKYCRLAIGCNPTVLELLWLPIQLIEYGTTLGVDLRKQRADFLSAKRVRDAYLGYATQQFSRLKSRNDGSFSSDTRKRTAKHARHLIRLLIQGMYLYRYGILKIRLDDPEEVRELGDQVAEGNLNVAEKRMRAAEDFFNSSTSPLPNSPNIEAINQWLYKVRLAYLE